MKDEIKEILEYLHRCEILGKNQVLTNDEIKILLQHITNLQEENKEYKRLMSNVDINSVDYVYDKDKKLYTFDRKNWYKINKKLDERFNYKQIIDKAIEYINSDTHLEGWINIEHYGEREQDLLNILKGSDKE